MLDSEEARQGRSSAIERPASTVGKASVPPRPVERQFGDAVSVPPFLGDPENNALHRTDGLWLSLRDNPIERFLEKRGWSGDLP